MAMRIKGFENHAPILLWTMYLEYIVAIWMKLLSHILIGPKIDSMRGCIFEH